MRHHGWELPYHPLQVTAVAGVLALGFAFYIFFVPFVEYSILETCGLVAYSLIVLLVCALYTWCVAMDPAHVHVKSLKKHGQISNSLVDSERASLEPQVEPQAQRHHSSSCFTLSRLNRWLGGTCIQTSNVQDLSPDSRNLFCRLCNAEIYVRTKHCRVCDKCVDGFDHHCQWLNNCVGKRNYMSFFVLIVAALFMFILQWCFGLWIIVQRLLRGRHYESVISLKLGRSFPSLGYLIVLVSCTVVAMVATYLLGQLVVFHALLIKKGLTTYEYMLGKRDQKVEAERECGSKILSMQGRNGAGSQQQHVEPLSAVHEHEGDVSSLKQEKDLGGSWRAFSQRFSTRKTSVKVNPWNRSFTNEEEDVQVASTSTHKLPTGQLVELECSFDTNQVSSAHVISSLGNGNASRRYSVAHSDRLDELIVSTWQNGKLPLDTFEQLDSSENDSGTLSHPVVRDNALNPLQREARNVFKSSHSFCSSEVLVPTSEAASSFEAMDSSPARQSHRMKELV